MFRAEAGFAWPNMGEGRLSRDPGPVLGAGLLFGKTFNKPQLCELSGLWTCGSGLCLIKAKIVISRFCGRDTINNTCVDDIDDVGDENRNKKPTWAKRFHMIWFWLLHFLFPVFALSSTCRMFLIIVIMIMVIIIILLVIMVMLISGDNVDQGGVDHNNDSLS